MAPRTSNRITPGTFERLVSISQSARISIPDDDLYPGSNLEVIVWGCGHGEYARTLPPDDNSPHRVILATNPTVRARIASMLVIETARNFMVWLIEQYTIDESTLLSGEIRRNYAKYTHPFTFEPIIPRAIANRFKCRKCRITTMMGIALRSALTGYSPYWH